MLTLGPETKVSIEKTEGLENIESDYRRRPYFGNPNAPLKIVEYSDSRMPGLQTIPDNNGFG